MHSRWGLLAPRVENAGTEELSRLLGRAACLGSLGAEELEERQRAPDSRRTCRYGIRWRAWSLKGP